MKIVLCEKKCAYDCMQSDRKSIESVLNIEQWQVKYVYALFFMLCQLSADWGNPKSFISNSVL